MVVLGLDTSTPVASVALLANDRVIERSEPVTTFSERLLPLVDALFAEAKIAPSAIDAVACAAGPGSFTGLRIGLSTCKGLCLATGAKLVLVPSLQAIAVGAVPGSRVVTAIDAFRGELYAGAFTIDADGEPQPIDSPRSAFAARPEALVAALADFVPTHYCGDGFAKFVAAIPPQAAPLTRTRTVADSVLWIAQRRLARGQLDDPAHATPLYVRPPAPEEKR